MTGTLDIFLCIVVDFLGLVVVIKCILLKSQETTSYIISQETTYLQYYNLNIINADKYNVSPSFSTFT